MVLRVVLAKLGGEAGPEGMADWLKHRLDVRVTRLKLRQAGVPHPLTIRPVLGLAGIDVANVTNVTNVANLM